MSAILKLVPTEKRLTFQREVLDTFVIESIPLQKEHWKEVALYQAEIPLEPDYLRYQQVEKNKALFCITARFGGELVGYSLFIVSKHLHYMSCLLAANDVIFLKQEFRKGMAGVRLIKESERLLREAGIHRLMWHVKPSNDWTPILKRLGYEVEDIVMGKLLNGRTDHSNR